jgi:DNA (cytosine-5)-methyltransferase 1
MSRDNTPRFYEFFAGGGMARAGLGPAWRCDFANDFDLRKAASYKNYWGERGFHHGDVRDLAIADLPGTADLVWASFPCQDLSLAGGGAGLAGDRSGTFWPFWRLMEGLASDGRAPGLIVLENVCGTLSSHGGKDFTAICQAFDELGYRVGAVVMDAALFLPQSRARLFMIGVHESSGVPGPLVGRPCSTWHPHVLRRAQRRLPERLRDSWLWWHMPLPATRQQRFADLVEDHPDSVDWHSQTKTEKLLGMMNELHLSKVEEAKRAGRRMVGTVYKRTRRDESGRKVQRAEIRFDDVAGCLRTPAGGSSRQSIVVVDGDEVRSRLISTRETARLMGLPDHYQLPESYNEAYHLTGDGVVVPVVRHLSEHILEPLASARTGLAYEPARAIA